MKYKVIDSGSAGNAVVVEERILIDCGVPWKRLQEIKKDIKLVLLTHCHGDHFKKSTIRRLSEDRPTIRFACGDWMVRFLVDCDVKPKNIDVLEMGQWYDYGLFKVSPVFLAHDVPNCGWKVDFDGRKLFYATDTAHLNGITAKNYDLYMVECNYETDEISRRIKDKQSRGEYVYEIRAREQHLSKEKCDEFIYGNIGPNGEYVYLHMHKDR